MSITITSKNVEKTKQRTGSSVISKVVTQYISQEGAPGNSGEDAFNIFITPNSHVFTGGVSSATDNQTDRLYVIGFRGQTRINTQVGTITGTIPNALTATVSNTNGSVDTYIDIHVSSQLTQDSGQLVIPVSYVANSYDSSTSYDASLWDTSSGYVIATTELIYSWALAKSGESLFNLDLSNENASINCDSSGNILDGAIRPTCTATLYYGTRDASEIYDNITYTATWPNDQSVQGVSINSSTGVLTFDTSTSATPFRFSPNDTEHTTLEITVKAKTGNQERGTKIMTISKSIPGAAGATGPQGETGPQGAAGENGKDGTNGKDGENGADAVSYWLELSANQIKLDASNNVIPNSITATGWKQVGEDDPVELTSEYIYSIQYTYDSSIIDSQSVVYVEPITLDASTCESINYITISLGYFPDAESLDSSWISLDKETVPILKDGKNGANGTNGRNGAVVRGPIEWDGSSNRRFSTGNQDSSLHPEDAEWIDLILHDGSIYVCTTNYLQVPPVTWNDVSSNWTVTNGEYDFIATKLLLAENAKINFLTGNELYLTNSDGTVVYGGARAPGNGNNIMFWAGNQNPDASANFTVDYQGNINAKSGIFSGFVQFPYIFVSELEKTIPASGATQYRADERAYLVSDAQNDSRSNGHCDLILPTPDASHNGFTYQIIVEPTIAVRGSASITGNLVVKSYDSSNNNSDIYCYAFSELLVDSSAGLYGGKYVITCMKKYYDRAVTYVWAIVEATGTVEMEGRFTTPVVGQSKSELYVPEKIYTHPGSNATPQDDVNRDTNTMFVTYN